MDSYTFIVAKATLIFLAAVLIIEYAIRRRNLGRDLVQNRQKQQQLAAYHAELKTLKMELARKGEIAEILPQITKKMTEKLPSDAYPAIAVRSIKEFFHAKFVGYFAPVEGSSDYSLVVGTGFPPDWMDKVRIHPSEGILGMALQNADDALYESKRQGRNRILIATSVGLDGGIAKVPMGIGKP